uniref:Mannose-binding protein C-like isoform X2 n=1 Tax=Phascolarctos cinereus TaxID=38626 RepID=A0A6P5JFQ3_PHACI|nr:mannose-binding protein C-like isoform X2 [Phascolarctos cinereus]
MALFRNRPDLVQGKEKGTWNYPGLLLKSCLWTPGKEKQDLEKFSRSKPLVCRMAVFSWFPLLLIIMVRTDCSEPVLSERTEQPFCFLVSCGTPGANGAPGKDGRDELKGEKGQPEQLI